MNQILTGFVSAVIEKSYASSSFEDLSQSLGQIKEVVISNGEIYNVLTDPAISRIQKINFLKDLFFKKTNSWALEILCKVIDLEKPAEIASVLDDVELRLATFNSIIEINSHKLVLEQSCSTQDARERLKGYVTGVLFGQSASLLEEVEDEIFRFSKIVATNYGLKSYLGNPEIDNGRKIALLFDLLEGKTTDFTKFITSYILRCGRQRDFTGSLDQALTWAAQLRGKRIVKIISAVELSSDELSKLTEAISLYVNQDTELQALVDQQVIGGLKVEFNEYVLDATIKSALNRLKLSFSRLG